MDLRLWHMWLVGLRILFCVVNSLYALTTIGLEGANITLSWNMSEIGIKNFTVMSPSAHNICLFEVKAFDQVRPCNGVYSSRVAFTGRLTSTGNGVFSFILTHVSMKTDSGDYRCYSGPASHVDTIIENCGQKLIVFEYLQAPYIEGNETQGNDKTPRGQGNATPATSRNTRPQVNEVPGSAKTVHLTCHVFTASVPINSVMTLSFIWTRNGTQLENGDRYTIMTDTEEIHNLWKHHHKSTLTIPAMAKTERDEKHDDGVYVCKAYSNPRFSSAWSEGYIIAKTDSPEHTMNYPVASVGGTATLTWIQYHQNVTVASPNGANLISVFASTVYIWPGSKNKVKIAGVSTSDAWQTIRIMIHNTTLNDAGLYVCRRGLRRDSESIPDCGFAVVVIEKVQDPYIAVTDRNSEKDLICNSKFRRVPKNHSLAITTRWRRTSSRNWGLVTNAARDEDWYFSTIGFLLGEDEERDADIYSCRMEGEQGYRSEWSLGFAVPTNFASRLNNYTVVKDAYNVSISWLQPRPDTAVDILLPSNHTILTVNSSKTEIAQPFSEMIEIRGIYETKESLHIGFVFQHVIPKDAGYIRCYSSPNHDYLLQQCGTYLILSGRPTVPTIDVSDTSDQEITLTCSSKSQSLPEDHPLELSYVWRRNGTKLENGTGYLMLCATLTLSKVARKYTCQYSCRAEEEDGFVSEWSAAYDVDVLYDAKLAHTISSPSRDRVEHKVLIWLLALNLFLVMAITAMRISHLFQQFYCS